MIPEAAVEAAAKVTFEGLFDLDPDDGWEHLTTAEREPYERQARAALESAAPHMLNLAKREAWDANVEIQRLRAELAKFEALRPYTIEDQRQHGETW